MILYFQIAIEVKKNKRFRIKTLAINSNSECVNNRNDRICEAWLVGLGACNDFMKEVCQKTCGLCPGTNT